MSKNSPPSALDDRFRPLWLSFLATYGSLRLFSEQLPARADRLDEQIITNDRVHQILGNSVPQDVG
ncbi:hypothetical protein BECAL_00792 [Bellilinea caldifistulae]|uniref:hypothetical protein n=1 Tax=Bellilinea caldifistulae TaxID=360411 RepID=UPI0011AE3594|nr:hypothetical protein [Bellilinea caldifistulae]GAP09642.1 hypothetical protein BECAL_00792 [Bellilinea caldifistulae]